MAEEVEDEYTYTAVEDEEHRRKKKKKKKKKETIDVTIETLHEHPDKISPFVGYFPSGFDPLKVDTKSPKSQEEPRPRVKVFRNEKRSNRLQLVVSPNGSKVDFVGTNYSGEAAAAQVCTYALGVLDKETQTLKIVPIASNKIFRLEPKVGGSDVADNEDSSVVKGELTAESKADKIKNLTLMYSTKKTINRVKKSETLHQKDDPKSQKDLDKKIEELEINKEALESSDTYNARNIPPHDMSATIPQMAYPLDKIILKGEWNYLLDIVELLQAGKELAPDVYPSFVRNRIHKLDDIEDDAERKKIARVFSYISHLIKFKDKHSMDGVSSAKYYKFPSILNHKFSSMFADSSKTRLSEEKKDLLISYILVLTLFADEFRTDPSDIARDLRMNTITLRPHYEHLGCKLVRERQVLLATLPVPLNFPKLMAKRRR